MRRGGTADPTLSAAGTTSHRVGAAWAPVGRSVLGDVGYPMACTALPGSCCPTQPSIHRSLRRVIGKEVMSSQQ